MKKKMGDWIEVYNALVQMPALPVVASFRFAKIIRAVKSRRDDFEAERGKLLIKYGKSEDGRAFNIPKENVDAFNAEMLPLVDAEECIETGNDKLAMKMLGDAEIPPVVISTLADFFDDK
jgi:hypothetical protein